MKTEVRVSRCGVPVSQKVRLGYLETTENPYRSDRGKDSEWNGYSIIPVVRIPTDLRRPFVHPVDRVHGTVSPLGLPSRLLPRGARGGGLSYYPGLERKRRVGTVVPDEGEVPVGLDKYGLGKSRRPESLDTYTPDGSFA